MDGNGFPLLKLVGNPYVFKGGRGRSQLAIAGQLAGHGWLAMAGDAGGGGVVGGEFAGGYPGGHAGGDRRSQRRR